MNAFLIASLVLAANPTPTWPQWRGPTRDGIVKAEWPENLKKFKENWRVEKLGPSYSGPIVSTDLVFTTETIEKKTEVASAFERATGKKKWSQQWDGSMTVPFFAASNGSWIRSTPAFDGESLFVAGIRDKLVCLNAASGEIRWSVDFMAEFKSELPAFGCVCSPLVLGDAVYFQAGAGFVKLNKGTGKVLWRVLPENDSMNGSPFSSPFLGKLGAAPAIFVQTRTKLAGVDPATGKVLFEKEIPSFRGMNILTPTPYADGLFTSTYGGTTLFLKLLPSGDRYRAEESWKVKYEGNMTSPVVIDDHAYLFGKDQKFICVDLKAGKEKWRTERTYGKYCSLVANGKQILALDSRGILFLIKANPAEFELLDEKKVASSETWAHLAVAGSEVVIRELNALASYTWQK